MNPNSNQEVRSKHIFGKCADHFHLVLERLVLLDHGKVEPSPVQIINNFLVTIKVLNYKRSFSVRECSQSSLNISYI